MYFKNHTQRTGPVLYKQNRSDWLMFGLNGNPDRWLNNVANIKKRLLEPPVQTNFTSLNICLKLNWLFDKPKWYNESSDIWSKWGLSTWKVIFFVQDRHLHKTKKDSSFISWGKFRLKTTWIKWYQLTENNKNGSCTLAYDKKKILTNKHRRNKQSKAQERFDGSRQLFFS